MMHADIITYFMNRYVQDPNSYVILRIPYADMITFGVCQSAQSPYS